MRSRFHRLLLTATVLCTALLGTSGAPAAALDARWPELEAYYRTLLTCTRSGGWVRADGSCDQEDANDRVPKRKALKLGRKLTSDVARPQARRIARAGYLSHDLGGSIRERFTRVGLGGGRFGENLGYSSGDPRAAVLHIHRLFQDEWSYDGWHWKNMTDGRFARVGIGVWIKDGRTWLAVDFHS
jgi:hypothetical protein